MRILASLVASSIFAIGLLAGCSGDDSNEGTPDGGGSSSSGSVPEGGIPIGEPGGHAPWTKATNAAHYKVFADRSTAIAWFNGADVVRGESGAAGDKAVSEGDARYADLDKKVANVWKGFEATFPEDTKDVPAPIVILVESAKPGAYAVFDPALDQAPNAFMIQTPTLALGDDALLGVIAHELTHHVRKHTFPGNAAKFERWYDATKAIEQGFGIQQDNDPIVQKTGKKAQIYGSQTGDYPLVQWNGFVRPGGLLDGFGEAIHTRAAATNAGPCSAADDALQTLLQYADPLRDRATNTLTPTTEQLAQIDTLSKDYLAKETTCTSVVSGTFFQFLAEELDTTEAEVRAGSDTISGEANDAASSAFDALTRIVKKYDEYMTTTDLKNVRYFSFEEEADDTSIVVLASLALPTGGMATYLKNGALDAAGKTKCEALVAAGEPPYGILSDPHHSTCWRIWHLQKIEPFLK